MLRRSAGSNWGWHECRARDHKAERDHACDDGQRADPDRVAEDQDAAMIAARLAATEVNAITATPGPSWSPRADA
jgi:hypothetical protein